MEQIDVFKAKIVRPSVNVGWGFRLEGGAEHGLPLKVHRVSPGSPVHTIGITTNDVITEIGDVSTARLTSQQAHDLLAQYGDTIVLTIERKARGGVPQNPVVSHQHRDQPKSYQTYDMSGAKKPAPQYSQMTAPQRYDMSGANKPAPQYSQMSAPQFHPSSALPPQHHHPQQQVPPPPQHHHQQNTAPHTSNPLEQSKFYQPFDLNGPHSYAEQYKQAPQHQHQYNPADFPTAQSRPFQAPPRGYQSPPPVQPTMAAPEPTQHMAHYDPSTGQQHAHYIPEEEKIGDGVSQSKTFKILQSLMQNDEPYAGVKGLPPPRSIEQERWKEDYARKHPGARVRVFMPQKYNSPMDLYSAPNVVSSFTQQASGYFDELERRDKDIEASGVATSKSFGEEGAPSSYREDRYWSSTLAAVHRDDYDRQRRYQQDSHLHQRVAEIAGAATVDASGREVDYSSTDYGYRSVQFNPQQYQQADPYYQQQQSLEQQYQPPQTQQQHMYEQPSYYHHQQPQPYQQLDSTIMQVHEQPHHIPQQPLPTGLQQQSQVPPQQQQVTAPHQHQQQVAAPVATVQPRQRKRAVPPSHHLDGQQPSVFPHHHSKSFDDDEPLSKVEQSVPPSEPLVNEAIEVSKASDQCDSQVTPEASVKTEAVPVKPNEVSSQQSEPEAKPVVEEETKELKEESAKSKDEVSSQQSEPEAKPAVEEETKELKEESAKSKDEPSSQAKNEALKPNEETAKSKEEPETPKEKSDKAKDEPAKQEQAKEEHAKQETPKAKEEPVTSKEEPTKPKEISEKSKEEPIKSTEVPAKPEKEPAKLVEQTKPIEEPAKPKEESVIPKEEEPAKPKEESVKPKEEPTKVTDEPVKPKVEAPKEEHPTRDKDIESSPRALTQTAKAVLDERQAQ